jgi:hypothetical protein
MSAEFLFALGVIILIILCIMAKDATDIVLIAAVLAMMAGMTSTYNMTYTRMGAAAKAPAVESEPTADATATATATATESEHSDENPNLRYGVNQREYDAYITSFGKCYPVKPVTYNGTDIDNSMDSNMAVIGQKRARDKRAIDGAVVKDANFYRHHFADELDQAEKKVWWGESEL